MKTFQQHGTNYVRSVDAQGAQVLYTAEPSEMGIADICEAEGCGRVIGAKFKFVDPSNHTFHPKCYLTSCFDPRKPSLGRIPLEQSKKAEVFRLAAMNLKGKEDFTLGGDTYDRFRAFLHAAELDGSITNLESLAVSLTNQTVRLSLDGQICSVNKLQLFKHILSKSKTESNWRHVYLYLPQDQTVTVDNKQYGSSDIFELLKGYAETTENDLVITTVAYGLAPGETITRNGVKLDRLQLFREAYLLSPRPDNTIFLAKEMQRQERAVIELKEGHTISVRDLLLKAVDERGRYSYDCYVSLAKDMGPDERITLKPEEPNTNIPSLHANRAQLLVLALMNQYVREGMVDTRSIYSSDRKEIVNELLKVMDDKTLVPITHNKGVDKRFLINYRDGNMPQGFVIQTEAQIEGHRTQTGHVLPQWAQAVRDYKLVNIYVYGDLYDGDLKAKIDAGKEKVPPITGEGAEQDPVIPLAQLQLPQQNQTGNVNYAGLTPGYLPGSGSMDGGSSSGSGGSLGDFAELVDASLNIGQVRRDDSSRGVSLEVTALDHQNGANKKKGKFRIPFLKK